MSKPASLLHPTAPLPRTVLRLAIPHQDAMMIPTTITRTLTYTNTEGPKNSTASCCSYSLSITHVMFAFSIGTLVICISILTWHPTCYYLFVIDT